MWYVIQDFVLLLRDARQQCLASYWVSTKRQNNLVKCIIMARFYWLRNAVRYHPGSHYPDTGKGFDTVSSGPRRVRGRPDNLLRGSDGFPDYHEVIPGNCKANTFIHATIQLIWKGFPWPRTRSRIRHPQNHPQKRGLTPSLRKMMPVFWEKMHWQLPLVSVSLSSSP